MGRLVFGVDDPPPTDPRALTECGWNPVCGHVLHFGFPTLATTVPGLTYGSIPVAEAEARVGSCGVCLPVSGDQVGAWDDL